MQEDKTLTFGASLPKCQASTDAHDKMSTCSSYSNNEVNYTALQIHSSVTCTSTPVITAAVLAEAEAHNFTLMIHVMSAQVCQLTQWTMESSLPHCIICRTLF